MMIKYILPITLLIGCGSDSVKPVASKPEPEIVKADYCHIFCVHAANKMATVIRQQPLELFELSTLTSECEEGLKSKEIANDLCKTSISNLDAMTNEEFVSYCHSTNWVLTNCQ